MIQKLGIADIWPTREAAIADGPPAPAYKGEFGATGTPIFSGFLRELGEYNPQFSGGPYTAFLLYEQMRRSGSQVAAVLDACKLPIRGAEWAIVAPDDATAEEKLAAEFVEENIFERCSFEAAMQNALLMLDFGVAAHEDVWTVDEGRVCLEKMAPRLPLTFYRWLTAPGTDDLIGLDQLGYRAGSYVHAEIPVGKLARFTFQQEGANYNGRALTRSMYQHWYTVQALYAIDAISCERNGMGVPVITVGTGGSKEDRMAAFQWVQSLIVHEKTGIVLPPTAKDGNPWSFQLQGVEGEIRDPKESIAHHNTQIAIGALVQFMMMGQAGHGSSGNRSLGETMSDFFFLGLQALANHVGQVFSETTIRRLVRFNFGPDVRQPRLIPQQLLATKIETIADVLNKLGLANMITPDTDTEAWLRKKLGMPEQMPDTGTGDDPEDGNEGTPVEAPAPPEAINPQPTPARPARSQPARAVGPKKGVPAPAPAGKVQATAIPAAIRETLHLDGQGKPLYGGQRQPRGHEVHLAARDMMDALDKGKADVAGHLRAARSRIQAEVVNKLVNTPVRNMHRVSIAPDSKLLSDVHGVLHGVSGFGKSQVAQERARQLAHKGAHPPSAETVRMSDRKDQVGMYADGAVSEFQNGLTARAANVAINKTRSQAADATKGELIRSIESELDDQADGWIDNVAGKAANGAFADGRDQGYAENKDDISQVIYSALLDLNTCGNCANSDGADGATPDDIPDVPNPDCDGGDLCRCVHVYVFADEGKAA